MTFRNPLLDRLAGQGRAVGAWSVTGSPLACEALITTGIDFVAVDLQHGSAELADLREAVSAIENRGVPALARVPVNDAAIIGRALDLGALGVIVPLVDDAEAAARAVAATRYAPAGSRSYGPSHFGLVHGSFAPEDAEAVATVVMVETRRGVENVDAIAATPGVSAILIGPSDLAIALGFAPQAAHDTPEVRDAIMRIKDACVETGVAAGIVCPTAQTAARYLAAGFRLVTLGSDVGVLMGGMARLVAELDAANAGT
jgi:4-hydroxy-2-oxoheptanedioate aldolase